MRPLPFVLTLLALVVLALCARSTVAADAGPPVLDLSGDWYVLTYYRDLRDEDTLTERFKDFAWSIEQRDDEMRWRVYPYVVFGDALEEVRKAHMRAAERWEPDLGTLAGLRQELRVSPRAAQSERLVGSRAEGFRSLETGASGPNTLTFARDWSVRFEPGVVRVEIQDRLGGHLGFDDMSETTRYEIQEQVGPGELRGAYREGAVQGTFRMLRARARRVVD